MIFVSVGHLARKTFLFLKQKLYKFAPLPCLKNNCKLAMHTKTIDTKDPLL